MRRVLIFAAVALVGLASRYVLPVAVGSPAYAPTWEYDPDPEVEALYQEAARAKRYAALAKVEMGKVLLPREVRLEQATVARDMAVQALAMTVEILEGM